MLFHYSLLALLCTTYASAFETVVNQYTRQNDLSVFQGVKCNRTEWKALVQPYLEAQGLAQRNPEDKTLKMAFDAALATIGDWKGRGNNINRIGVLCNVFQFAECDENSQCVCGTGKAPYNFQLGEGSTICLSKRGSICVSDNVCADGLKCENLFCGGREAFLEESAGGMAFTAAKASMLLTIVGAMYFLQ